MVKDVFIHMSNHYFLIVRNPLYASFFFNIIGRKFLKKSPSEGLSNLVPDLDDMEGTNEEDEDRLVNGGNELVYGL